MDIVLTDAEVGVVIIAVAFVAVVVVVDPPIVGDANSPSTACADGDVSLSPCTFPATPLFVFPFCLLPPPPTTTAPPLPACIGCTPV